LIELSKWFGNISSKRIFISNMWKKVFDISCQMPGDPLTSFPHCTNWFSSNCYEVGHLTNRWQECAALSKNIFEFEKNFPVDYSRITMLSNLTTLLSNYAF
jgi:hypothetical protein